MSHDAAIKDACIGIEAAADAMDVALEDVLVLKRTRAMTADLVLATDLAVRTRNAVRSALRLLTELQSVTTAVAVRSEMDYVLSRSCD